MKKKQIKCHFSVASLCDLLSREPGTTVSRDLGCDGRHWPCHNKNERTIMPIRDCFFCFWSVWFPRRKWSEFWKRNWELEKNWDLGLCESGGFWDPGTKRVFVETLESGENQSSLTSGGAPSMVPIDSGGRASGTTFVVVTGSLTSKTNWNTGTG